MVIHRSKFPKDLEYVTRGIFVGSGNNYFKIKFPHKKDKIEVLGLGLHDYFEAPNMKAGVLCKYGDSKKELISEIYTLDGKFVYRKRDF